MKLNSEKDNRKDGMCRETFRDGTLMAVGKYAGGKTTGMSKYRDKIGKLTRTKSY